MLDLYEMLMESDEHKLPYMKVKKNFKFYGLSNMEVIEDILATGKITPSQYNLRSDKSYKMSDAVYFTDDLSRAFNWYATKRGKTYNEDTSNEAFVFVIDPDTIDQNKVYFDEMDFYIAMLGITVYNLAQLIQEKPSLLTLNTGVQDSKFKIDIKTSLHSDKPLLNKFWNRVLEISTDVLSSEVNRYVTPFFDILRTFGVKDFEIFSASVGGTKPNTYNNMNFRYNKPTSFNDAELLYKRLYESDAKFREWVSNMSTDIINNIDPQELYRKNIGVAHHFTLNYQKMLVRFVKNFCSSFAYRDQLKVYGYFRGNKNTLSAPKAKELIYHIGTRYLKTEEQAHAINDYMKQFNKTGLGITFKKYG